MNKRSLSLLFPFLVWLGLNHGLFTGHLFLGGDNFEYFHSTAYYMENIARGVYPLWNPFHAWGSVDNFDMKPVGDFNPICLLMSLLFSIGVKAYWAFLTFMVLYFWAGCLGFYVLARRIMQGYWGPWLAYVLLLFSSLGITILDQVIILIIFVPAVWFFVFLIDFVRAANAPDRLRTSLGAIFTLMIIASSYIPFYFIVMAACFALACLLAASHWFLRLINAIKSLAREAPWVILLYVIGLTAACVPSALWYQEAHSGQYVLDMGRSDADSKDLAVVSPTMINSGALATQASGEEVFEDFDTGLNHMTYVPVLFFILLGLSLFNRTSRTQIIILICGFLIFLVAVAGVTPIHAILYKHVFIFHLFRNYLFFWPAVIALAFLFGVGELQAFLSLPANSSRLKMFRVFYVAVVHVVFFLFLCRLDNVPVMSYVSVILSAGWFIWRELSPIKEGIFIMGLGVLAMLQPWQVIPYYQGLGTSAPYITPREKPQFVYLRPVYGSGLNEASGFHFRDKRCQDESGFVRSGYFGTQGSYDLHKDISHDVLAEYVRHKFVLYDRTMLMDRFDRDLLSSHLGNLSNEALVNDPHAVGGEINVPPQAQELTGPIPELKVTAFDLNVIQIKTAFSSKKFLVYNDSYHPGWQAFIDGKKVVLERANWAFKGLWVEPGEHIIDLRFYSVWRQFFFMLLSWVFFIWFMVILVLARKAQVRA